MERNIGNIGPSRRFVFDVDAIRAYHGGERVVVEAEVVMAPETTLRESHDACLLLQQDLESMDEVERAFVHADYAKRAAPEHAGDASRATEARDASATRQPACGSQPGIACESTSAVPP